MKRFLLLIATLMGLTFAFAQSPNNMLEQGRAFVRAFWAGDLAPLWANFTPEMKQAVPLAALQAFRDQSERDWGRETAVIDEQVKAVQGFQVYVRSAKFEKISNQIETQVAFDDAGRVAGLQMQLQQQPANSRFLEYQTKTPLRLPFKGTWLVVWGGRSVEQNYHAVSSSQRFALDLLVVRNNQTHEGDGARNEQYFAFGQPILAPADALVTSSLDGIADNTPGQMNPAQAAGNHIWLDFGNGEYALLAHFKQGSIQVKAGQRVKAGELLGLCGNSGNSSEAHLHFHLQNDARPNDGEGLPAQFLDYLADGVPVARGEPKQGQLIQNP